jgi:hypothetical protein
VALLGFSNWVKVGFCTYYTKGHKYFFAVFIKYLFLRLEKNMF